MRLDKECNYTRGQVCPTSSAPIVVNDSYHSRVTFVAATVQVEIFEGIKFCEFRVFVKFIHEKKEIYMVST